MDGGSPARQATLRRAPLFAGLGDGDLSLLAALSRDRALARGEILFGEGEEARGFFILTSGYLKLIRSSADGREKVLHFVHPGESFAEAAVFGLGTYPATAVALERSEVLAFPRDAFRELLARNPRFALNLIVSLSNTLRRFAREIEELSFAGVPARLASYLLELAGDGPPAGALTLLLPVGKGELASRLGTANETLSRVFRKLSEEGIVEVRGRRVTVRDRARLRSLAGEP
jgi:CRP/FNR family transcriptional regulator